MNRRAMTRVTWALTLGLMVLPLGACAGQDTSSDQGATEVSEDATTEATAEVDISSLKTLGDVMAIESEGQTSTWNEEHYVYVTNANGAPLRAVVDLTPETYSQIEELDFLDEKYDQKLNDIIGGLELASLDDYSDQVPSQDEMDALVGKTGKELFDDGFTFSTLTMYGGDETVAELEKDLFRYEITFDGTVGGDADSFDGSLVTELPVASVSFIGLSDEATNPENVG